MEKEAQAEYAELLRRLYEAISSLTPTQARRVHARYMLGMKVKDIAAMEGITPSQAGEVHPCGAPAAAPVLHTPEMDKRPMKTINLKKYYYPICKKDTFVEVPDEVAEAIVEESRAENANDAKQHYHCYSLDASPGIEHHFPEQVISPEDILMEEGNGTGTGSRPCPDDGTSPGGPCHPDAPAGKLPSCPVLGGQAV